MSDNINLKNHVNTIKWHHGDVNGMMVSRGVVTIPKFQAGE